MNWKQKVMAGILILLIAVMVRISINTIRNQPPTQRVNTSLTEDQKEYLSVSILVELFNASQTNWTLTLTPRTNTLKP
jgi:hypothetical protein